VGLTSGQFSLLMSLNRSEAPDMAAVAALLAMDRTTLTAALKPLRRRRLVAIRPDAGDRRRRRLSLTTDGRATLAAAVPVWRRVHAAIEAQLDEDTPDRLRRHLRALG